MKTTVSTFIFLFLFIGTLSSQLTRTGSFVAFNPGTYPISGDVSVVQSGGVINVIFEANFNTIQGFTLEVFLGKNKNLNTGTDILISTAPLDSGTAMGTPITGTRNFTVPAGTDLYEYDNIIIQCTSANVLWGHANLCETNLLLPGGTLASDNYKGELVLDSESTIPNGTNTSFEAANYVTLLEGFEAQMMCDFLAIAGIGYGCIIQ